MLGKLFRKKTGRVFLGAVAVLPRKDIKRHMDQGTIVGERGTVPSTYVLESLFALPSVNERADPVPGDVGLDVMVTKRQLGNAWWVELGGPLTVLLFWRPKVTLAGRSYELDSGQVLRSVVVTKKMPWCEFWARMFSWNGLIGWRPVFDTRDLNRLLTEAAEVTLDRLRKAL